MVRSSSVRPHAASHKLTVTALAAAISIAIGSAHAQSVEATSTAIRGRAPVVTIQGVTNGSVPGQAPKSGHQLHVDATATDPDDDAITDTRYEWKRGATVVGTGADYTTTTDDAGKTLTIAVTAETDPAITDPTQGTASESVTVSANSKPKAEDVSVMGTLEVGQIMTGLFRYTDADNDPEGEHAFQWYRADDSSGTNAVPIDDAVNQIYMLTNEDQGKFILFGVKPRSTTGSPNEGSEERKPTDDAIAGRAPTANPTITFTGALEVGRQLNGNVGFVDADNDTEGTHEFKWYRADNAAGTTGRIEVATTQNYTVQAADQAKYIVFEVVPKTTTGNPNSGLAASAVTANVVPGTAPNVTNVDFSGTWAVGETLTASFDLVDAENDPIDEEGMQYQWSISHPTTGSPMSIEGATGKSYQLRPEDQGANRRIWFSVEKAKTLTGSPNERLRPTSPAGQWQKSVAGPITGRAPTATPSITFTAPLAVGKLLTGNVGFEDLDNDTEGTHEYKWYRADDVAGTANRVEVATTKDYTVQSADQGKYLVFEVIPKTTTGNPNSGVAASAVTATAVPGTAPSVANVNFTGTWAVGETLTATFDLVDADNDSIDEDGMQYQWQISHPVTGSPTNIAGATGKTYQLRPEDQGTSRKIWFSVEKAKTLTGVPNEQLRPTSPAGQWQKSVTGPVVGRAPTANPSITFVGNLEAGKLLTGNPGFQDLDNDTEGTHAYKWYRASDAAGTVGRVEVATTKDYTVQSTDQGKYLVFEVIPKTTTGNPNSGLAASAVTAASVPGSAPYVEEGSVNITGVWKVGEELTGNYTYKDDENDPQDEAATQFAWYISDQNGANPQLITEATTRKFTLRPQDQGGANRTVWFRVKNVRSMTGTPNERFPNPAYQWQGFRVGEIVGSAPTAAPTISFTGTLGVGTVLTANSGYQDVDNDGQSGTTYQWCAYDAAGTNLLGCAAASTTNTWTVIAGNVGRRLSVKVIPRSSSGNPSAGAEVESSKTDVVPGREPEAQTPSVGVSPAGALKNGTVLTANYTYFDADNDAQSGTTFQWFRKAGATITDIASATGSTYTLTAADQGDQYIGVKITPKSATGNPNTGTTVLPQTADKFLGSKPQMTNFRITGTRATVGSTVRLEYDFTDAQNDPDASTYKWCRMNVICGIATTREYVLQAADVGRQLDAYAIPRTSTGTPNSNNEVYAVAWPTTGTIQNEAAPTATPVSISGTVQVGSELTGSYTYQDVNNDDQGATTMQWYTATDAAGNTRTAITGATTNKFTVRAEDAGKYIVYEVTPRSVTGVPQVDGTATRTVTARVNTAPTANPSYTYTGTLQVGNVITGISGYNDVDGDAEEGTTYQWCSYELSGNLAGCAQPSTTKTYTIVAADNDRRLRVRVIPKSATGSPNVGLQAESPNTAVVVMDQPIASNQKINGNLYVGEVLSASFSYSNGGSAGGGPGTPNYKWYRSNDASGTSGKTLVQDGTNYQYTLQSADVGKYIIVEIIPKSRNGASGEMVSANTATTISLLDTPSGTGAAISGTLDREQELTASFSYTNSGTGSGTGPGGHVYTWYRSNNTAGTSGKTQLKTGTSDKYTLQDADQGKYIIVEITPKSANGTSGTMIGANTSKEVRYSVSGSWQLGPGWGATRSIDLTVGNRAGNAPSNLRVGLSRGATQACHALMPAQAELQGPSGTRYPLNSPTGNSSATSTIDASSQPGNGTWKVWVTANDEGWSNCSTTYTNFTLEFTP